MQLSGLRCLSWTRRGDSAAASQALAVLLVFIAVLAAGAKSKGLNGIELTGTKSSLQAETGLNERTPLGAHYLLLVAGTRASSVTPGQLNLLNQSAYDGLAVRFIASYDTVPIPCAEEMSTRLLELKKSTTKDLWPWVSINRMVGRDPEIDVPYGRDPYFTRFRGMDLDGRAGPGRDFLSLWANSLRAARQAHAPGIVFDPELYLNNKAYDPMLLAQQIGRPLDETLRMLHDFGVRLADTAAKEYPNGVIWSMFTDLGQYGWKVNGNVKYYPTTAYYFMGMLDEIRDKHYNLKVISGGEVALEYCSFSVDHLKHKIEVRSKDFAPHRGKYGVSLELAGTIILWPDRASKSGFMTSGPCLQSDANTVEDQQRYLEVLFKSYRYNWIYGTGNSGYDPFNPATASRFNAVIKNAREVAEVSAAN